MEKYQKQLRKYNSYKKRKERITDLNNQHLKKQQKTFFDKLYIRIFLSSILLLLLLLTKNIFKLNEVNIINNHMNIFPLIHLFTNVYDFNNKDLQVDLSTNYEYINYKNGINYITNESFNGVNSASTGIVVKISKHKNIYSVTIKDENEFEYIYDGLNNLDVSLYSYVLVNDVIGSVESEDSCFRYTITIDKNDKTYSLINIYE